MGNARPEFYRRKTAEAATTYRFRNNKGSPSSQAQEIPRQLFLAVKLSHDLSIGIFAPTLRRTSGKDVAPGPTRDLLPTYVWEGAPLEAP